MAAHPDFPMEMAEPEVEAVVRQVTDEEVAHYCEFGWVMLRELVAPAFAAEMLATAARQPDAAGHPALAGVEPFRSFMFSHRMSSNAAKLANRRRLKGVDVPMRWRQDSLRAGGVTKAKRQPPSTDPHGYGANYHQDSCEHGSDRVGELQFWLALDEVTPAMGPMRFINRSHREGPLGSVGDKSPGVLPGYRGSGNILEQYPLAPEVLGISSPEETHYRRGDVTVHHGYCAHGSINNTTGRDRLSYLFAYSPADTRYWLNEDTGVAAVNGLPRLHARDELANPVICRPVPLLVGEEPAPSPAAVAAATIAPEPPRNGTLTEPEVAAQVREVTDTELAHYREYGWVMLRGLVAPALATEMLGVFNEAGARDGQQWPKGRHPARDGQEPFRSFMYSERCAQNAIKLLNRKRLKGVDVPIRYRDEVAPGPATRLSFC